MPLTSLYIQFHANAAKQLLLVLIDAGNCLLFPYTNEIDPLQDLKIFNINLMLFIDPA